MFSRDEDSKVEFPSYDLIESKRGALYHVMAKYGNRYVVSKFEKNSTSPSSEMHFVTKSFFDSCNKIRECNRYEKNLFFAACFIEEQSKK